MRITHLVLRMFSVAATALAADAGVAQNYPNKPVRIVASEAGGGGDFVARLIAQGFSSSWGNQVIVDNRGIRAGEIVAKAPADGYTLLSYGSPFWLAPFLRSDVPYDPVKDFSPISLTTSSPNILVVHPGVAANSVKDLIALAKAKPGELNYATGGAGGAAHLSAELFKAMAGVNIVHVPYKGTGTALTDLIGGQVQVMFASATAVIPQVKSGRLRALAVSSAQPSALFPGLQPIAATIPGYEAAVIFGLFAPAKTPPALITQLNQEVVRVLNRADVKEKLYNAGADAIGSSPAQLAAAMKAEMVRMGKVIKDAGIGAY